MSVDDDGKAPSSELMHQVCPNVTFIFWGLFTFASSLRILNVLFATFCNLGHAFFFAIIGKVVKELRLSLSTSACFGTPMDLSLFWSP